MEQTILELTDKGHIGALNTVRYFKHKKKIGLKEAKEFVESKIGTLSERQTAGKGFHEDYIESIPRPYHINPDIMAEMYVLAFENTVKEFIKLQHAKSKNSLSADNSGSSSEI